MTQYNKSTIKLLDADVVLVPIHRRVLETVIGEAWINKEGNVISLDAIDITNHPTLGVLGTPIFTKHYVTRTEEPIANEGTKSAEAPEEGGGQ